MTDLFEFRVPRGLWAQRRPTRAIPVAQGELAGITRRTLPTDGSLRRHAAPRERSREEHQTMGF